MSDLVLPDGTEINFDLGSITTGEYLSMFDKSKSDVDSDITLAKVSGIDYKWMLARPFTDYKRILAAFFKKANAPLESDPNLPGAST